MIQILKLKNDTLEKRKTQSPGIVKLAQAEDVTEIESTIPASKPTAFHVNLTHVQIPTNLKNNEPENECNPKDQILHE